MNLRRLVDIPTWFPTTGRANKQSQHPLNQILLLILGTLLLAIPLVSLAMTRTMTNVNSVAASNPTPITVETPNYNYMESGMVRASASPVTVIAVHETPVQKIARAVPQANQPLVLEGEASFYSRNGCLGCDPLMIMANGQPLNDNALTMAIGANRKHLVGYKARVTNLATTQSTVVTITDTGGFYQARYGNRVADLTVATKQAIGMKGGVGQVRVEVLSP